MSEATVNIDGKIYNMPYGVAEELIRLGGMVAKLKEQVEAERWIPVVERLPDRDGDESQLVYVVFDYYDETVVGIGYFDFKWKVWDTNQKTQEVTHWKPINLPKGESCE